MRTLALVGLLVLSATACASGSSEVSYGCDPISEAELDAASPVALSVSPNQVAASAAIALHIGGVPDDAASGGTITGWGSVLQCWNGLEWVDTHILEHGMGRPGEVIALDPDAVVIEMPALGLPVPDSFEVTVPDLDAGWYRIEVTIISGTLGQVVGHVGVEVTSAR